MIKKYKLSHRKQIEHAICFEYSNQGIQELRDFCGDTFLVTINKDRHIGAIGKAILYINKEKYVVNEGDYVTMDLDGNLATMNREYFINCYEEIL
jgi:hypothetical protein